MTEIRMPGNFLLGSLVALAVFIMGLGLLADSPRPPKSSIHSDGAIATKAAKPGGILIVRHGITGECPHPDGGRIIARVAAVNEPYDAEIKELRVTGKALAPGGALTKWKMPERFPTGQWRGSIRVWCFGVREPFDLDFSFQIDD